MDEVEKLMPSSEDGEEKDEEINRLLELLARDAEEDKDGNDEQEGSNDDVQKEKEVMPPAADIPETKAQLPAQPKEKKQPAGLNLNNEVVKMRKEVKRVRALIIRKMTRQIAALKKKKGNEMEIERNQRRAARLVEEIHAMKTLSPDHVTKTALHNNLNFEQECKNPKSTLSDRAIARIGTHPQFNKKIEDIKAAVKAFKVERIKSGKQAVKEKAQNKSGKATAQSPDKKGGRKPELEEDIKTERKEITHGEEGGVSISKDTVATVEPEKERGNVANLAETAVYKSEEMSDSKDIKPPLIKSSKVKDVVETTPTIKDTEKKPILRSAPEVVQKKKDEEESDLESSDEEEKQYFDDSTEERFHKQSSQSEDSDDGDDFFIGKVSKLKKKKKQKSANEEKSQEVKVDHTDPVQSKLDELESRLKSKTTPLQSVFCSSLSKVKPGGGRGAGRGRGGDTFRGQGKPRGRGGLKGDFNKESKFQKQEEGTERNSWSKYSKSEGGFSSDSRGRGRGQGRGDVVRQGRGGRVFSHQEPQQALHPSWEASKKRKEQQGQILAFQGKKIKFDIDD